MTRVITYGTYDLLHHGHIRLLERAKALGDYLIVGITADDFDKSRGKINVQQSLMERIEAVKALNLADEIIIEEYEGQKIDDIRRLDVDIFTVGSDWIGQFDYLREYCQVVYLDRTQGVSSSEIRQEARGVRLGIIGDSLVINKYILESAYVNGITVEGVVTQTASVLELAKKKQIQVYESYNDLLSMVDAVYVISHPTQHFEHIKQAILAGKHVLCESPIALTQSECHELFELAKEKGLILMDAIKTAYATAYNRMLLLAKSGKIGRIVAIDATCTSLMSRKLREDDRPKLEWSSLSAWGPTALLPILQILGIEYKDMRKTSFYSETDSNVDIFTKLDFVYDGAVATIKVAKGVKSEGELIISGTQGYIYVPAPWWKMDYFELRYENQEENKRYFYQLDGEGIRYELVAFAKSISLKRNETYVSQSVSEGIAKLMA